MNDEQKANGGAAPMQLVSTEEAARILGVKAITLRKARCNGKVKSHIPPVPYIKLGRTIRYDVRDLYAYAAKFRCSGEYVDAV